MDREIIFLGHRAQLGPDTVVGKYFLMNDDSHFAHGTAGNYCSIGFRCCLNAQNHPTNWLSTHGFQYHRGVPFSDVPGYRDLPTRAFNYPPARVNIGHDVWIGNNVNIIGGVNIGTGAIIGAGSTVTKHVHRYAIVAGNPAIIIGYRFEPPIIGRLLKSRWWELEPADLGGYPFDKIELCLQMLEERQGV